MNLTIFTTAKPAQIDARMDSAGFVRVEIEGVNADATMTLTVTEAKRLRDALSVALATPYRSEIFATLARAVSAGGTV